MVSNLKTDLTTRSASSTLLSLATPMVLGVSSSIVVQTIELGFIGQLSTTHVAAITFTFPIVMILTSIALGISIGTSSVIARKIGSDEHSESNRLATHSLILVTGMISVLSIVGWLAIDPLFTAMGASAEVLPLIHSYLDIYYPGTVLFTVTMVAGNIMRAHGSANIPGAAMTIGAFINLALDPILIFGWFGAPRMELAGAATAMLITRIATSAVLLYYVFGHRFAVRSMSLSGFISSARKILHVGLPAMATQLIGPVSGAVITRLIASHGETAVAGFGVATRIEALAVMLFFALSGSIGPFVGQNAGAQRYDRVKEGVFASYKFCIAWGVFAAIVLYFLGGQFASWIDDKEAVVTTAALYLALVPWSYGLWGILMMSSASFNALGKPLPSTTMSFMRMFILNVPMALVFNQAFGYEGVFLSICLSNTIMGLIAYVWLNKGALHHADTSVD